MRGLCFCVSYERPDNEKWCRKYAQSIMWDNGAFSAHTRKSKFDYEGFQRWVEPRLRHPHWAVAPDVIGGSVEDQRDLLKTWRLPKVLSAPVWHLHLPLDWLLELADIWPRVCFGSSQQFWKIGSPEWTRRIDEAWEYLHLFGITHPHIHMLRAMDAASKGPWPFASADSTNVARNFKRNRVCPELMARKIDSVIPNAQEV